MAYTQANSTPFSEAEFAVPENRIHDSLRRRANAGNVSFRISLRWPIYIVNSVIIPKNPSSVQINADQKWRYILLRISPYSKVIYGETEN